MKILPTADDLKIAFTDFSKFTLELLTSIESRPDYLKFAAVNSQIALELFLKYLYVTKGKASEIQKKKGGVLEGDFVDFTQILNHYCSTSQLSYGKKSELAKLIDTRNLIIHKGQKNDWDKELATSVIRTLFFIHATAWSALGETFLFTSNVPHEISKNKIWKDGVQSFVDDLEAVFDCTPLRCFRCKARTVINGEIMALEKGQSEEDIVCLNCFSAINIEFEARLMECGVCTERSYLIDAFNEQADQLYVGKCSECQADDWVRRCRICRYFYHPFGSNEISVDGLFFCGPDCAQSYSEMDNNPSANNK